MSDLSIVEWGEPEESSYLALALEIARELDKHYPAHPWEVSFQGGALIVRHKTINAEAAAYLRREGFGMVLPKDKLDNPKEVVHSAIMAGGAMLELFGLKRGAWDGSDPKIPKDWRPRQEAGFA
jgi:hypothetical protein